MNKNEFKSFFEPYAKNVDNANSLMFWKLSDEIILNTIKKYIPTELSPESKILDAGGGTGRWVCNLSKIFNSSFILYDLSEDMLEVAKSNINKEGIQNRVKIMQGDLINMDSIPNESIDYIISIYSPISFIYEKENAVKELYRILKKGGKILIMGHGFYNAIYSKINNYSAPATEINLILNESMVKWADFVPKLNIFSKESMEGMLKDQGFNIISTCGIPVFVQPGPEDFDSSNKKISSISKALQNKDFFDTVLNTEIKFNERPEVANRGMNIFTIAQK